MAEIILREDENLDAAIRRFKRAREKEGTVRTFKRKRYYTKPSDEKREKKKKAIRRLKKKKNLSFSRSRRS